MPCQSLTAAILIGIRLASAAEDGQNPIRLEPGVIWESRLADDEAHHFEVEAGAGQSWRIELTLEGNGAEIRVGDGHATDLETARQAQVVRALFGQGWTELLTWTSHGAVAVPISLRAVERGAPVGNYRLSIHAVPQETDPRAVRADLLLTKGAILRSQAVSAADPKARSDHLQGAAASLEEALELWRQLGARPRQLHTLIYLAQVRLILGESDRAAKLLATALPLSAAPRQAVARALILDRLGFIHLRQGNLEKAGQALDQALELWQQLGQGHGERWSRRTRCLVDFRRGDWAAARSCYEGLLTSLGGSGEESFEAGIQSSVGGVYARLGEPSRALASHQRALDLSQSLEDANSEAQARNNLGALHRSLGEPEEGLAHYREALAIFRQRGNLYWQGRTLNNLGYTYLAIGDLRRAETLLQEALALRRRVKDRRGEAVTLRNLGRLAARQRDSDGAIDAFSDALAISRSTRDRRGEATASHLLGQALGHAAAEARQHLDRALELRRELGDQPGTAAALLASGQTWIDAGRLETASPSLQEALRLYRAIRDPAGETRALYALARLERQGGDPKAARPYLETALSTIESLRFRLTDPGQRAAFLAARRGTYELLIEVLMDLHRTEPDAGHLDAAFEVSERARARTLLDLLEDPAASLDRRIAPELREGLRAARRRLQGKVGRQLGMLGRPAEDSAVAAARSEVQKALSDLEALLAEARRGSPSFAALDTPTLTAARARRLLDEDTALLEFVLGETRGFLMLMTAGGLESFELPGRETIEGLAGRAYLELTELDLRSRRTRRQAARQLARTILAPALPRLTGYRRLVIVADGLLHYIPFPTLPLSVDGAETETLMVERWEVVHLPSASALALQRRLQASRPQAPKTALILADPVFDTEDPRLRSRFARPETPPQTADVPGLPSDLGLPFDRLPHTRSEATAIADLAPPGQTHTLMGFDASLDQLRTAEPGSYRILHFATHGLAHPRHPELSGLMLSRIDSEGRPRHGFLGLHDLLTLELQADLAVLSGCHTGLGQELRGEGLLGLARGFQYAGVPRVVASLWQVQDEATAELMARFYQALLEDRLPASAALRQAQLALRQDPRFRDPFYWGAFLFQGDWQ